MQHKVKVHNVTCGKRERMSFSKVKEVLDMPNLIEVQKNSYRRFLEINLREVLDDGRIGISKFDPCAFSS